MSVREYLSPAPAPLATNPELPLPAQARPLRQTRRSFTHAMRAVYVRAIPPRSCTAFAR